ncbi:cell envelope integrity protein CreD [Membranihabitans maritimus]|uniref:cell envelope integrity protein CreD n=1 Tax=Membranihabitans maritimus TaxID=2904244 RepID=UPI001EFF51A1|nr:cell envelope integrity protein CreD [Membranihabitans maritimus]
MKSTEHFTSEFGKWFQNSATIKLVIIAFLSLLLMIPSAMIQELINERMEYSQQIVGEIDKNWAGGQLINGPILTIPIEIKSGATEDEIIVTRNFFVLPENLIVNGRVIPKILSKGIYDAVVYQSELNINGTINIAQNWEIEGVSRVRYDKAFLTMGVSDVKGIKEGMNVVWNGRGREIIPGTRIPDIIHSGVTIELDDLQQNYTGYLDFEVSLNLNGSGNISFIPIGKNTEVEIESSWTAPSFMGDFLPDTRAVSEEGFNASWKILEFNRNFPQSWMDLDREESLNGSAFGVDFIIPVDNYKKSLRSVKYALMVIALTFLMFFLFEITLERRVHPFQYGLVGLGLTLFYILLIALSEYVNFDLAYVISALVIISMISLYSLAVFREKRKSGLLFCSLVGMYGFLFTILRLEEYALLIGSIGLVVILALVMYFTRNISWYDSGQKE